MKYISTLTSLLLLTFSTLAFAVNVIGDAVAGKTKAAPCAACHGQNGHSQNNLYPSLAGQGHRYILTQLRALQSGERAAPLMAGQLTSMSEQDLLDIATYYAAQTPGVGGSNAEDANFLKLGEKIYRGGIANRGVAPCIACHSPRGQGNSLAGFPRLSGQLPSYTTQALQAYREKTRGQTDNGFIMQDITTLLHDREIEALANYIYGLH